MKNIKLNKKAIGELLSWTMVVLIIIGISALATTYMLQQTTSIGEDSKENFEKQLSCQGVQIKITRDLIINNTNIVGVENMTIRNDGNRNISKAQITMICGAQNAIHSSVVNESNFSISPSQEINFLGTVKCPVSATTLIMKSFKITPYLSDTYACPDSSYEYINRD